VQDGKIAAMAIHRQLEHDHAERDVGRLKDALSAPNPKDALSARRPKDAPSARSV
jgi:hypothetical protein